MKRLLAAWMLWALSTVATAELNYQTYTGSGAQPCRGCGTPLTTGVVRQLNYNWGGGAVLDTGRNDRVVIKFWGSITVPGSGPRRVTFYGQHDDGFSLRVGSTVVIDNWNEQGPRYWNSVGTVMLEGGQTYPLEAWWYENGGGAMIGLYWDWGGGISLVENTATTTATLCCGASTAPFTPPATVTDTLTAWSNSPVTASVRIEAVGNNNTLTVEGVGTPHSSWRVWGDNNQVTGTANGRGRHWSDVAVTGSHNTVEVTQSGDSGTRAVQARIGGDLNRVRITQSDTGSHLALIEVAGGNKTVAVTQTGSGSHTASITLTGAPVTLDLTQSGATGRYYSITFNCAGNCAPITVIQR